MSRATSTSPTISCRTWTQRRGVRATCTTHRTSHYRRASHHRRAPHHPRAPVHLPTFRFLAGARAAQASAKARLILSSIEPMPADVLRSACVEWVSAALAASTPAGPLIAAAVQSGVRSWYEDELFAFPDDNEFCKGFLNQGVSAIYAWMASMRLLNISVGPSDRNAYARVAARAAGASHESHESGASQESVQWRSDTYGDNWDLIMSVFPQYPPNGVNIHGMIYIYIRIYISLLYTWNDLHHYQHDVIMIC